MSNNLLIIDGYGFVFRAFHVQPPLISPTGIPTGAVYGFSSMLIKIINDFKPTHAVVVLDSGGKNFRHHIYPEYKSHRPTLPNELISQLKLIRTAADILGFKILEKRGYEADDIIATLATKAALNHEECTIISSDKDLMQLINEFVKMYDPIKNCYITDAIVLEKFGVRPDQLREVMALIGDKSDNIPGIPSVGPKTAAELIKQFGTVQNMLDNSLKISNEKRRNLIDNYKEQALLSWNLVGLDSKIDLELETEQMQWLPPHFKDVQEFIEEYGFKSLLKRFASICSINFNPDRIIPFDISTDIIIEKIENYEQLEIIFNKAQQTGLIAIHINKDKKIRLDLEACSYVLSDEIVVQELFTVSLHNLLDDLTIKKITNDLKFLLKKYGRINSAEDLNFIRYVVAAGKAKDDQNDENNNLINEYIRLSKELYKAKGLSLYYDIDLPLCYVINKIEKEGIKIDSQYLAELSIEFGHEIKELEQEIYKITDTEFNIGSPKQLGEVLFDKMDLPFGKVTSKAKNYSTGADILEKLSIGGYRIADLLLRWRQLTKLKNTYSDALPTHANPDTNRIHTTFLQDSTTTARLSSQEPNLQNIPIRSSNGSKIRKAFIASPGHKLISADYSQIELRILSDMASIEVLKLAFTNNEDIHTQTASRIFDIDAHEVNSEHRRKAKAINFGIIYGISAFGLARQLNISSKEADLYIKKYFEEYPGIYEYMERTKEYAREHGYVENLFSRRCHVPLINNSNSVLRQLAERAAINAPIQGTNADIIRIAMLDVDKMLVAGKFKTKMILQIHDELLFEAPAEEISRVTLLIKEIMERPSLLNVPIIVETKIGDNWLEMQ